MDKIYNTSDPESNSVWELGHSLLCVRWR